MIQAVLSNQQHPEYGVATVPFPIVKDEYDHILALLEPLGIGDAVKQDCHIEEVRGDFPALIQMEMTNANLDELDYLAKRLDSFDEYEKAQFQGMASRLEFHSADEFINLTFCCQEATVVTDFSNMEALGRRHFLTMNGGAASPEEMQGKDFGKIALELLDQQVGRVTHYGVVYDNDFEMTELYDGRRFPEYHYEDCVLEVEMSLRFDPVESPAAYLYLPMTQSQIERAMLRAGIDSYGDMSLQFMESKLPDEIDATLDFENENIPFSKLDTPDSITRWNRGELPVALVHPASAGHGLNLQSGGSTLIWFGLTWSLELYQQTNARLWRQGQTAATVVIHHIITKGTIDRDIMAALRRKDKTQSALIAAVKANLTK